MTIGTARPGQPLPPGWRWARLGEVADYVNGRAFKPDEWTTSGRPIIRIQNLTSRAAPFNYYSGKTDARHEINDGDLLISWSASLDAFVWDRGPATLNQHIFKVIENARLVTRTFLYFAARYAMVTIREQVHGATMQHITKPEFEAISIPVPPLPEQRRIAALLTEQLAAVDRARAAAEAQLRAASALPAAQLAAVFCGTAASSWPTLRLAEVGNIGSGVTLGRKLTARVTRPVPYLRVANVKDGYLDLSDVYDIEVTEPEIRKWRLQRGDLLLTEGGDPDKLGRGTYWESQIPECIHQNHIFRVRFDQARCSPAFIAAQMGSVYGKRYFLAHAKRTTGIATINQRVLGDFPLLLPPISAQERVVAHLSKETQDTARVIAASEQQLAVINKLPAALLRQAFSGEL